MPALIDRQVEQEDAAAMPRFQVEDIPAIFKERGFADLPHEKRGPVLDYVIGSAYDDLAQHPEFGPEAYQQFRGIVDQARVKLDGMDGAAAKTGRALAKTGHMLKGMAQDVGAVVAGTLTPSNGKEVYQTMEDSLTSGARELWESGKNAMARGAQPGAEVHAALDKMQGAILDGGFLNLKPEDLKAWDEGLKAAQATHYADVRTLFDWGRGYPVASEAERGAARGVLGDPDNVMLMRQYVRTQNPQIWDELKRRVFEPPPLSEVREERKKLLESPGARAFDQMLGQGASEHLVTGSDPLSVAALVLPFMRGAGAAGEAAKATSWAGKAAEIGLGMVKAAPEMGAFGAVQQLRANPESTPGQVAAAAGDMALTGSLAAGAIGVAGTVLPAVFGRKGAGTAERPAAAPEQTPRAPGAPGDGLDAQFAGMDTAAGKPETPPEAPGPQPVAALRDDPFATLNKAGSGNVVTDFGIAKTPEAQAKFDAEQSARKQQEAKLRGQDARAGSRLPVIPDSPLGGRDVLDFLNDNPLHIPKKGSSERGHAENDWSEQWDIPQYYRKFIASSERGHNAADLAQMAFDEGLIREPTPDALMAEVQSTMEARTKYRVEFRQRDKALNDEARRLTNFEKAQAKSPTEKQPVSFEQMAEGDELVIDGENVKVKNVEWDEDGHLTNVTIEDGKRFGVLSLDPQTRGGVLVDEWKPKGKETGAENLTGGQVLGFTTAKGSRYTIDGTSTTREKAARPEHPGDFGLKDKSYLTVYVSPEFAREIGMFQGLSSKGKRIGLSPDGKVQLFSENSATGKRGREAIVNDNTFSLKPEVGLAPLELFDLQEDGVFKGNHPGNAIVKLHTSAAPENLTGGTSEGGGFKISPLKRDIEGGFVSVDGLTELVGHAARAIANGVKDFATWAAEMVKQFGEKVKEYLEDAWHVAVHTSEVGAVNVSAAPMNKTAAAAKPASAPVQAAGTFAKLAATLGDSGRRLKETWEAFNQTPKFTPFREAVNGWVGRMQSNSLRVMAMQKELMRQVPDGLRREGITNWIQAGGDDAVLAARAAQSQGRRRAGYETARKLTAAEKALAEKIRGYYETALATAQSHGLVNEGIENYVNQVWKRPMRGGTARSRFQEFTGQLARNFKFGKQRTFESFFEGEQAGYEPQTKDIAKLLPLYLNELSKVIATRNLIQDLTTKTGSDGRPLAVPLGGSIMRPEDAASDPRPALILPHARGQVRVGTNEAGEPIMADTSDFQRINHPSLAKWKWVAQDSGGEPVMLDGELAVHPEAYKVLKNALGKSALKEWVAETPDSMAGLVARKAVGMSDTFNRVVKQTMLGLSPFHIVQEGTHAVGHKVNPFYDIPKIDPANPVHVDAMKHGLMLAGESIGHQHFMEGLGSGGPLLERLPVVGPVAKMATDFTFHRYIPGLKLNTYEHIVRRNMARFKDELAAGKLTEGDVKYLSAKQTNAAYGHLNYKDMGRNPTFQHLMSLFLLAPDFLEARAKFTGQSLQGLWAGKVGREQLAAMATLATTFFVAARIGNALANNGDMKLDKDHLFTVQAGGRMYAMRSVPEDIYRLFHDWRRFTYGRLSPVLGHTLIESVTGLNYRGEKVRFSQTMEDTLLRGIPASIRMAPGLRNLTESTRNNPVSPWEQFMGSIGLQITRQSPIVETQKLASSFMEAKGETSRGSYPVSRYQQLRYALEDLNWDKAASEIEKLAKDKGNVWHLRKGFKESLFRPWTGTLKGDREFKQGLNPEQRALLDLAESRRREMWERFLKLTAPN